MEENVALDTSKQKKFVKSIKGIKKLLKKKQLESTERKPEPISIKPKVKKFKRKTPNKGLVYLSHIPHGFYEEQMTDYFNQFGPVTNVRVIRSKRTGHSKGHAFVEFKEPIVAQIVAETMNNYLMGKRLIKAAYIPPEKIRPHATRKNWTPTSNPSAEQRFKQKKAYNAFKTEDDDLKKARKILTNLRKTKQKLSDFGINYDFFTPVDIPEALIEIKTEKEKSETVKGDAVVKTKSKKKGKKAIVNNEVVKDEPEIKAKEVEVKVEAPHTKGKKKNKKIKKTNSDEVKVNVKDNQKNVYLKKENVKPLEDFIQVQNDSDNDDSSVEFDSDEFEKMLENDSDSDSLPENAKELGGSDSEESVIDYPPKKTKATPIMKPVKSVHKKMKSKKEEPKKNTSPQIKRKASSTVLTPAVTPKKPKFEKQGTKISTKKQFKKKK